MFNLSLRTIVLFLLCSIVPWGNTLRAQAAQDKPAPAEDQKPAAGGDTEALAKARNTTLMLACVSSVATIKGPQIEAIRSQADPMPAPRARIRVG